MVKQDIFDKISLQDIFDRVSLDLFDKVELEPEEKILYSKELKEVLQEELKNAISKLPIGSVMAAVLKEELKKKKDENAALEALVKKQLAEAKTEVKNELAKMKKEEEDLVDKLKQKYTDLRNEIMSTPKYEFGGFAPPSTVGHASEFLTNDGVGGFSWAAGGGASSGALTIGDGTTDGSWRMIISSTDLIVQYLTGGIWTESSRFIR